MFPDYRILLRDRLLDIARALSEELDPGKVLERILRTSVELLRGDAGIIALPREGEAPGAWRIAVSVGLAPAFLRDLESALAGPSAQEDAVAEIQRRLQRILRAQSLGAYTTLGLPMTARGVTLGAVFVFRAGPARFTSDERALLQAFAGQAAVAAANARLFAQVREEKQRLDAILDASAEGIAILGPDNRIQRINPALARLTGITAAKAVGQPHDSILRFRALRLGRTLAEAEAGGWPLSHETSLSLEGDLLRADGSAVPAGATYAPVLSPDRSLLNIIAEVRDLTRFREAEEMKDTFISVISHELKTPVALIKGYASTLRREDAAWDRAVVADSLAIIEEEADRLGALIEDLLDASRLQAGGLTPAYGETRIPPIAERLAERFHAQNPDRLVKASFPDSFPAVPADEERIRQVLVNLVSNAIKYSPAGAPVEIRGRILPDEVVVTVSDQGPGIAAEDLPHVFERFYRSVDAARRTKGAGLGLYLAKAVVEAHGGRIWVESPDGRGTQVSFSLPRNPPERSG